jgi:hypothetical protein
MPHYSLENLRVHTQKVRLESSRLLSKHGQELGEAFHKFSERFSQLESEPKSVTRNVRMLLACKFLNHIYAALLLSESGMIVDSILCERNALETLAFHWLVCLDPLEAEIYNQSSRIQPVDVRRKLEKLGVEVSSLRDLYASASEVSHVGRASERFQSQLESPNSWQLMIGGAFSDRDIDEMFKFLPVLMHLFWVPQIKTS